MDVIIAGLGAMGSAAAAHLAARGKAVLGLDRFSPLHDRGSSHGASRVIRQAYFESPAYVPLLLRAYELWRRIEHDSALQLLTITGGLMIGSPGSEVLEGSLASARMHGIDHEVLSATEIRRRYPPLQTDGNLVALYERMAGVVHPEQSILAHQQQAVRSGATLQFDEAVLSWEATADSVRVRTSRRSYEAERLVLAAGAWAPTLLRSQQIPLIIERQVMFWFEPRGGAAPFHPDRFPIWIWEIGPAQHIYGFPAQQEPPGGVKTAFYHGGQRCDPDSIDRRVQPHEELRIREALAERIPSMGGPLLEARVCMYTNAQDHHFILGIHPQYESVVVVSPCSGHGFKFMPVIGEIVADLVIEGTTKHPIGPFAPTRFTM